MTFRKSAPARDTFLVLEGEGRMEIDDGPTLNVKPGSMVSIPPGVEATWHVTTAVQGFLRDRVKPLARPTRLSNRFERQGREALAALEGFVLEEAAADRFSGNYR